jgi:hypothetical protein
LIYDDVVRLEQANDLLGSYPCTYDPRQRRITAVDAQGRQQYHQVPVVQFMFWTSGLVRAVWQMPRYGRHSQARRGMATRPMGLFDSFAT